MTGSPKHQYNQIGPIFPKLGFAAMMGHIGAVTFPLFPGETGFGV
jgi:hypothetical protein